MSALNLIKRYTSKAVGIIVDRHAPPPSGKLTEDPQGEWMKWNDLAILYNKGVLIEKSEALDELVADGHAQRAFMRDVQALGYEDFDQVMKVLKDNREQVIQPREFEIWSVGYVATGEHQPAFLVGKAIALSFNEACVKLKAELGLHKTNDWKVDASGAWSDWCGRLRSSEAEAKAVFG